jgi:hypothetical protein
VGLYLSAYWEDPKGPDALISTLRGLASLFIVTGAVSILWDLRGRRALTNEVLSAAQLSSEVRVAGLCRVAPRYLDVEWEQHMASAQHVDLFFAYARTWRATHASELMRLVQRDGTRLRVVLPDLANTDLMRLLAQKFRYTVDQLTEAIRDAESDFANYAQQASERSEVELRRTGEFPVFTYYRFDRTCVAVLYAQAPGRTNVPAFECEQGGSLYAFFRDQFDELWDQSVRPSDAPATIP